MASTVLASRNQTSCGHQPFMGEIPNFSNNNNLRHLNPNPNLKPKSSKKKHFLNNSHPIDSIGVVTSQTASDDAYSFNQRPIDNGNSFNCGPYVTYNVASCSRSEINELRRKLVSDLERVRKLNDRIQVREVNPNPRSSNGKFKKLSGNKRTLDLTPFGSNNKEGKQFRQGLVNGISREDVANFMKLCRQALTKLMKHKLSWIFKKPVDAEALGLHDYHQIIKRPMDLGTVKLKLSQNKYASPLDFSSDVRLVFENAMLYNPRTDDVHRMADQLFTHFEELFRPIQALLATYRQHNESPVVHRRVNESPVVHRQVNESPAVHRRVNESPAVHRRVNESPAVHRQVNPAVHRQVNESPAVHRQMNEFSAVDELDGSSWDDVQSPERSKKLKTSGSAAPSISNKQNHSTASNPIIPPVVQPVVQPVPSPVRTPSPMQAVEPIKPSSTTTRGLVPKLPKPRAKDLDKREMNMEEKQKLGLGLQSMPPEKMPQLLQIIRKRNDQLAQEGDEIELDIEALDTETLWELDRFVTNWKKFVSKTKRQALMVNSGSVVAVPSASADIDDAHLSDKMDVMKKGKKEAGEEDVDIGEEMPESSFPHVEIEKDDGGGQGEATTGHGNDNASSSSSGSSSSSSGDSSSSSDSGSGSSSGSDSDADDAQS